MKDNLFIEETKHIKVLNNEKNFSINHLNIKRKKRICYFLIFSILYTIFIIYITSSIVEKKYLSKLSNKKIDSKLDILKSLTYNDKKLYEGPKNCLEKNQNDILCVYQFICPKKVIGKTRVLIGHRRDGSYVMLDDFEKIKIAYSIGINKIIQFDKALADKGIEIYMYDHTIDKLPYENDKFHWKKIGLGGNVDKTYNIQTLQDMIYKNGHLKEKNMILKIDIEGAEWNSLNDASEEILSQFKYILIEYHFFKINHTLFYNVLKKIYKTHQAFYVNCVPNSGIVFFGNNTICRQIEISYIIRKNYSFSEDDTIYPIPEFSYGLNILNLVGKIFN